MDSTEAKQLMRSMHLFYEYGYLDGYKNSKKLTLPEKKLAKRIKKDIIASFVERFGFTAEEKMTSK